MDSIIIEEYKSGMSSLKLAKKYGCSKSKILNILEKNGIERRSTKIIIPDNIKKIIVEEYKKGTPINVIVEKTGIKTKIIYEYLNSINIVRNKNKKISKNIENEICKEYLQGKSINVLMNEYKLVNSTIWKILNKNGIKTIKKIHNKIDEDIKEKIIKEYLEENSICELSEKYGYSPTTIARWIKAKNLTRTFSDAFSLSFIKGRKHFKGTNFPFYSKKNNEWFFADSTWEVIRMEQLENDDNVVFWEKSKDRIYYEDENNKSHYYIPDLKIINVDNTIIVEEIKPKSQINYNINQIKFREARKYYDKLNIVFKIVTENEIGLDNIKNFNPDGFIKISTEIRERRRKDKRNERERNKRKNKKNNINRTTN